MGHLVASGHGKKNQLQVTFIGKDGKPYLTWQDSHGKWSYKGSLFTEPSVKAFTDVTAANTSNRDLHFILVGDDGKLYDTHQDHLSGDWHYDASLRTLPNPNNLHFDAVTAATNRAGHLQVVCLTHDHEPYLIAENEQEHFEFTAQIANPHNLHFKAVATGFASNGNLRIILLSDEGYPYVIEQDQAGHCSYPTPMDNPLSTPYTAVVTGVSYNRKLNVILLSEGEDAKPYLITEDAGSIAGCYEGPLPYHMNLPPFAALSTGMGNDGTPQVIGVGKDGQTYLIYQDHLSGFWSYYGALPTHPQQPDFVAVTADNGNNDNLQVICLDENNQPSLIWQDHRSGAWCYYGYVPYLTQVKFASTAMGVGNGGNLQVVCLGQDGQLYLSWQDIHTGKWAKFDLLPIADTHIPLIKIDPTWETISMGVGNDGSLQLLAVGQDQLIYLIWQDQSTGAWSFYGSLSSHKPNLRFASVSVGKGNSGNLQVICMSRSGLPYLVWQDQQSGGWFWYGKLPVVSDFIGFKATAVAKGNNDNLQLVGVSKEGGLPTLIWQDNQNGGWAWYGTLPHDEPYPFYTSIVAARGGDGNLQVVCLHNRTNQSKSPDLIWQDKNNGGWNWYGNLPQVPGNTKRYKKLTMCLDHHNQLNLYCLAEDGQTYCIWQDPQGNWFTSGKVNIGGKHPVIASYIASAPCTDGHVVLFIGETDGRAYLMQLDTNGNRYGLLE